MATRQGTPLGNDRARDIAVNCLLRWERQGEYLQDQLEAVFKEQGPADRERSLAMELSYGACRHLITLDHLMGLHSHRALKRIDPILRQILRVGLYQVLFLDRTPDFAAVDAAVSQAKAVRQSRGGGFVNAVLRSVQRAIEKPVEIGEIGALPRNVLRIDRERGVQFDRSIFPNPTKNLAKYFSLAYSYPQWLLARWLKRWDRASIESLCLANNSRPPLVLRVNRLRGTTDELVKRLTKGGIAFECNGQAVELSAPVATRELPGYDKGLFSVQDVTAMSAAPLLGATPHERVLDLCAAPGGKTTHLAELMNNQGTVVACDVSGEKLERIDANCQRLGITIVRTCLAEDLESMCREQGPFDRVLVDVPCSNTGVLSRRVEARHHLAPNVFRQLAPGQLELLRLGATLLKPGGKLVYSTCSIEPAENEGVVETFLAETDGFRLEKQHLTLGHAQPGVTEAKAGGPCRWQDGGYVALLGRSGPARSE